MSDASLGTAVLRTRLDASGLKSGLQQAEAQTKQALGNMSQQFAQLGSSLTGLGTKLTVGITAPLSAIAGMGLRSAMQLETFSASLRVLVGDVDRANHAFDELYAFDGETLFDWRTLSEATRVLAAYGTEAEGLVPTLRQLGEIAAGTQSDLAGLAEIYGRIQLTGRVTMQEINQLAQRGVPIIQELAAQFGVAEAEVAKLVSSGRVGFPQIQQAVESLTSEGGRFFGMMAAQADTAEGRLSNMQKTFEQVTEVVGQRLLPAFDATVGRLTSVAQGFLDLDASTQQTIVNVGSLAAAIGPLTLGAGVLLTTISKLPAAFAAMRAGLALLAGPAGLITLAALAAGGLALSLAFRPDSLDAAAEKAAAAFNAGDAKSLSGALDDVIGKFDGELKQALINAQNELHTTGLVGVNAANDIARAFETLRARNLLNQREIPFLPFAPAVGALNQAGAGMFGARRIPNAAELVQTALAVGDIETALATVTQALDVLAAAPRSGAIDALRDLQTQLQDAVTRVQTAEFVPATVTPIVRATSAAVTAGLQGVTIAAGEAAATVEDVFAQIAAEGTNAERRALAFGNTAQAQAESISSRIRTLNSGLNELLTTHGLDPLDARIQYIVTRLAQLNTQLRTLNTAGSNAVLAPPGSVGTMTALRPPGSAVPVSIVSAPGAPGLANPLSAPGSAVPVSIVSAPGAAIGVSVISAPGLPGLATALRPPGVPGTVAALGAPGSPVAVSIVAAPGMPSLAGLPVPGNVPGSPQSTLREWADEQKNASVIFAENVAKAGLQFVDLIGSIQAGDTRGIFGGIGQLGGAIANLIPGGSMWAPLIQLGGQLLGSLFGGNRGDEDRRRAQMAQQSRSVPAVNINFTFNQTNQITDSVAGPTFEAMMRRIAVDTFEGIWARSGIEQRLSKLGV